MTLTTTSDGTAVIEGPVVDQAALHGPLRMLRGIGLPPLSVIQVDRDRREFPDPSRYGD